MSTGVVRQNPEKALFHATLNEVTGLIYLKMRASRPKPGMVIMTIYRPEEKFRA
jgi:hypothetical protein